MKLSNTLENISQNTPVVEFTNCVNVVCVNMTPAPLETLIAAIRTCKNSKTLSDTKNGKLGEGDCILIKRCIEHGHLSPLEHIAFTFETKLSKVASAQLTRHRTGTYSIESQRSCMPNTAYIPDIFYTTSASNKQAYMDQVCSSLEMYKILTEQTIRKEDARYILSEAFMGNIMLTFDLRNLRHFLAERMCVFANEEIRKFAFGISEFLRKIQPILLYNFEKCNTCQNKDTCKSNYARK